MKRRLGAAVAAVPLLFLTACGPQPGTPGSGAGDDPPVAVPADADEVVLRIEQTGGFVPPNLLVSRLPTATIYGDGRLITEGPVTLIYPGPALPNVQEVTLPEAEIEKVVRQAADAGVGRLTDLGQPPVADAPNTRFTVLTDTGVKTLEVMALTETDDSAPGLTAEQKTARKQLRDLVAAVTDLAARPGGKAYEPAQIAGIAGPYVASDASLPKPPEVAWPGPTLPGDPVGTGLDVGCAVADGATLRALVGSAPANAATPWTSGGKTWSVALRPLLPDETGCADLTTMR